MIARVPKCFTGIVIYPAPAPENVTFNTSAYVIPTTLSRPNRQASGCTLGCARRRTLGRARVRPRVRLEGQWPRHGPCPWLGLQIGDGQGEGEGLNP
jgi:hypothetical protein